VGVIAVELRQAYQNHLEGFNFTVFATLTYEKNVSEFTARKDLNHFKKRLYSKLYRKKSDGLLSFVGFLEENSSGCLHWHLMFQPIRKLSGETGVGADKRLQFHIKNVWLGMKNTPYTQAGTDLQLIYEKINLINYLLKSSVSAGDFDFIEYAHFNPEMVKAA